MPSQQIKKFSISCQKNKDFADNTIVSVLKQVAKIDNGFRLFLSMNVM